jgi:hypothetical protein
MIENISFDHDYLLTGRRLGLVGECFDITAASIRLLQTYSTYLVSVLESCEPKVLDLDRRCLNVEYARRSSILRAFFAPSRGREGEKSSRRAGYPGLNLKTYFLTIDTYDYRPPLKRGPVAPTLSP